MRSKVLLGFACFGVVIAVVAFVVAARLRPGVGIDDALPAVSFKDAEDNPVAAADFRGKVVLLDFWQST